MSTIVYVIITLFTCAQCLCSHFHPSFGFSQPGLHLLITFWARWENLFISPNLSQSQHALLLVFLTCFPHSLQFCGTSRIAKCCCHHRCRHEQQNKMMTSKKTLCRHPCFSQAVLLCVKPLLPQNSAKLDKSL